MNKTLPKHLPGGTIPRSAYLSFTEDGTQVHLGFLLRTGSSKGAIKAKLIPIGALQEELQSYLADPEEWILSNLPLDYQTEPASHASAKLNKYSNLTLEDLFQ